MQKELENLLMQENEFGYYRPVRFAEFCNVMKIDTYHPSFKLLKQCWNTAIRSACNGFIGAEDTDHGFARTLGED
jgi:hypothetical protein